MMVKMSWTDRVKNEEVLHRATKGRNILHSIKGRRANWTGHIWSGRCLLKHVFGRTKEGNKEMTEIRGRRRYQLLCDVKEIRAYWKFEEEALDPTLWRTRFGSGFGPVVRHCGNK